MAIMVVVTMATAEANVMDMDIIPMKNQNPMGKYIGGKNSLLINGEVKLKKF